MALVVTKDNLGTTFTFDNVGKKINVNIDGTTITKDGNGVLKAVAFDASGINGRLDTLDNQVMDLQDYRLAMQQVIGVSGLSTSLGTFAGTLIPDNQTIKQALQTLETAYQNINITGQFAGSASTFAGLPASTADGKPVNNSDWAILTTDDGANQAGIYVYNGTAYVMAAEIPDQFAAAATNVSPKADGATGSVGTQTRYAREDHKHAAQLVSADAGNLLVVGTDGLHKLTASAVKGVIVPNVELTDAFGDPVAFAFSSSDLTTI